MPRYNNRAQAGQPVRPYSDNMVNVNTDCWFTFYFVDRNGNAVTPTSLAYQIDDLTNNVTIKPAATVTPGATSYELNIPASVNQMTYGWAGSQVNQLTYDILYGDGSREIGNVMYTIIAVATVGGGLP